MPVKNGIGRTDTQEVRPASMRHLSAPDHKRRTDPQCKAKDGGAPRRGDPCKLFALHQNNEPLDYSSDDRMSRHVLAASCRNRPSS